MMIDFKPQWKLAVACCIAAVLSVCPRIAQARTSNADVTKQLSAYDVVWKDAGKGSADSMPLGNGEIGLNVWTEQNGDLLFYIGKTDAWSEHPRADTGLMKVGLVRVSLSPNPYVAGKPLVQALRLHEGAIEVTEAKTLLRVWVDANHPVIHIEMRSEQPLKMKAELTPWYTEADRIALPTVVQGQKNEVAWFHHNGAGSDREVLNWTVGAVMKGEGFENTNAMTLESAKEANSQVLSIYPFSAAEPAPSEWLPQAERAAAETDAVPLQTAFDAHVAWWDQFWHRSWILLSGGSDATEVTRGYILQRFVTACAGRGNYPIKFNGSLFVVENPAESTNPTKNPPHPVSANYRAWGGQYWFQNTRAMYWPRLMAGDFDIMQPLFKMYAQEIQQNAPSVAKFYGHSGSYIAETAAFYATVENLKLKPVGKFTDYYFTPVLELSMMMLDYYDYTGDKAFARQTLVPVGTAGLTFFDQNFPHDAQGKLVLDPDNAIEMYWMAHNPSPDIAGLHAILPRLLALPDGMVDEATRNDWKKLLGELPDLPEGMVKGAKVLLPYEGEQTMKNGNSENPELYAVYPFRLYGLGQPDLDVALNTWKARKIKATGCWVQDPIQAAMLGLTDDAQEDVTFDLTRKDPRLKFPAFWERGHDYMPDEDNGGNGENGLQEMLMQINGRQIMLLPAWPKDWNGEFKLHAPYETTVEGRIVKGKLVNLKVTPESRTVDVTVAGKPSFGRLTSSAPDRE
jgi:alpha-L-fucosidase 2